MRLEQDFCESACSWLGPQHTAQWKLSPDEVLLPTKQVKVRAAAFLPSYFLGSQLLENKLEFNVCLLHGCLFKYRSCLLPEDFLRWENTASFFIKRGFIRTTQNRPLEIKMIFYTCQIFTYADSEDLSDIRILFQNLAAHLFIECGLTKGCNLSLF